jgi:hypothetical protein
MVEDLSTLWDTFSLMEDEDVEVVIQKAELKEGETFGQACVLGKLVANWMVSRETIISTLMQWWKPLANLLLRFSVRICF